MKTRPICVINRVRVIPFIKQEKINNYTKQCFAIVLNFLKSVVLCTLINYSFLFDYKLIFIVISFCFPGMTFLIGAIACFFSFWIL